MTVLVPVDARIVIQGITGKEGRFHAIQMRDYFSTTIVGGVSPGKGGEWVDGIPVFDSVEMAVQTTDANISVIFVPREHAPDAIYEAIDAGIRLVVCITEGIPLQDMMTINDYMQRSTSRLLGPNCPGLLIPNNTNVGIIPTHISQLGNVGVISKSGALTYDVVNTLTLHNIGQSMIVGVGADPIVGTTFVDVLEILENDPTTEQIVILGEIGGRAEIDAAEYIKSQMTKRVVAFVAGQSAPPDRRMGHAGAIIERGHGTAQEKIEALRSAGVRVVENPEDIVSQLLS